MQAILRGLSVWLNREERVCLSGPCAHGTLEALGEDPWRSAGLVASQALVPGWTRAVCALS